ncbi:hypothetical protein DFH07DRAFT_764222 [Mycena maculata]|uniref:Uncharacterized protein n=1 Tax=Mycena maculata TaxID=230809 RepID=A0AAD7KIJ1_9AGAR|nr:hypothetical protein DFH07DRAFT_764222 [Mycena maculata]
MEDSLMDDSNLPPDTQMLNETAESAITAMVSMDVDAEEKLDFGGGSPTPTLDEPEDLFLALTPSECGGDEVGLDINESTDSEDNAGLKVNESTDNEDNAGPDGSGSTETEPEDLETDELSDQYTGDVTRKQVRVLQMELAVSEGRLKEARTDLAEERRCAGRNIAETAVLRDEVQRLKNKLDQVYNERDDARDRATGLHADLKEAESTIDQVNGECVQLREELDRLRSYGDGGRDRKRSRAEVHPPPEGSGKARRIDAATVEGIDPVDEDMAMPPVDDTTPAAGGIVRGIEAHNREITRIARPPPGWEAHRWDRHGLPVDIGTWTSMFEVHKHQHVWPYGYTLFCHYLFSKGVPGASCTDVQKHALEHYRLYDWVSELLIAVGSDHGALKNGAAIERYKECSPNAVRNYNPTEYGWVIQYRQKPIPAVKFMDDCWTLSYRHLRGANFRQALSQWPWSDDLALVTEREFIQRMADMGVGITLMESGCNYARELLLCIMHGEVPPKTSLADWTVEEATDVFNRAHITGSPIYEEPEETDILLQKPGLPYEMNVLTKPAFHMFEWMHPDVHGIPCEEGSRIQALINANRHHPPSNYHAQRRVAAVNPFLTAAQHEAAKQDAMNSRRVVAPVQGPAYAPSVRPTVAHGPAFHSVTSTRVSSSRGQPRSRGVPATRGSPTRRLPGSPNHHRAAGSMSLFTVRGSRTAPVVSYYNGVSTTLETTMVDVLDQSADAPQMEEGEM